VLNIIETFSHTNFYQTISAVKWHFTFT